MIDRFAGIYGIVDRDSTNDPVALLETMLEAGVRVVQYRAKHGVERSLVRAMHARTHRADAILIVNDDLEAAFDADGWHGGQDDLAGREIVAIRALLGTRVLGISCGTVAEALVAGRAGADYLGVGPFANTRTKRDAGGALGRQATEAIVASTACPVVAIGGIDLSNLAEVRASGARMAAVISAIAEAADPAAATRALVLAWETARPVRV
ncbi:MAG: thiamine phosphate synthase [Vulcanimicrobiaceae bacterium]